jgi:transcriptional regulator with XRE-family HTH domain
MVGLATVPAVVHEDFEDVKRRFVAQIAENIQREDLTDMELGRALARMRDELKMSQREIAKMLGKPDSHISRLISAANPENEGDLGLCGGNAITLERFRALPDDAKEVLRSLGATVSVPDIIKVNNVVKSGVALTAENIQDVLTGTIEAEKPAQTKQTEKAPAAPQSRHEEENYMTNVSDAGGDLDDDNIFSGAEVDESTSTPTAATYSGDTGLDGVASDFRSPTDTGVEDMLLSVSVKVPVTRARELLKLLGGDADMAFDDMAAALSDLLKG